MRIDIESDQNATEAHKTDSLEAVDLLKEQFKVLSDICQESEDFTKNHFAKYQQLLQEQSSTLLALDRANVRNELTMYQHNWTQQQMDLHGKEQYKIAQLQQSLSNLTLRSGLMSTEKQAAEKKANSAQDNLVRVQQQVIYLDTENSRLQKEIASLASEKATEKAAYEERVTAINGMLEEEAGKTHLETEKVGLLTKTKSKLTEEYNAQTSKLVGLKQDVDQLIIKYNQSLGALEQRDASLISAKKTIEELEKKDNENQLARKREAVRHASELSSLGDRFAEYKKDVEVSLQTHSLIQTNNVRDLLERANTLSSSLL